MMLDVVQARILLRLSAGAGKDGKQNGCQNRDDCDHDQQLNEGET